MASSNSPQKPVALITGAAGGIGRTIAREGFICKLGGFFPAILPRILPWLERIGEHNRRRYL